MTPPLDTEPQGVTEMPNDQPAIFTFGEVDGHLCVLAALPDSEVDRIAARVIELAREALGQ